MKKIIVVLMLLFSTILIGCNSNPQDDPLDSDGSTLVVYFSATGNTKNIANMIVDYLDATEYEIIASVPYSSADLNYNNSSSRSSQENSNDAARPEIANLISSIDEFDVIYIGYPIWWNKAPKIIYTFLESFDFSGKTIIPFATSSSTDITGSVRILQGLVGEATWLEGRRFGSSSQRSTVNSWIDSLSY